jgi:hypothetical protein
MRYARCKYAFSFAYDAMKSEIAVYYFKAVLYGFDDTTQEWVLTPRQGREGAQMYIFVEDLPCPKYRMVGWIQESGEVLFHNQLTHDCIWLDINDYFVQYTTDYETSIGFSFLETSAQHEASSAVRKIIKNLTSK